ncbi:ESX secretion-associated protein EspG [Amycolatopsis sp. NPDC004368]
MPYSFTLSPAAVDLLLEQQSLGRAPAPFAVPHIGITGQERAGVREAVFRDLGNRGLVHRGYLDDDLELALTTFVRGRLVITATAQLDSREQLFARVASTGDQAVLVKQDAGMFVFEQIRPTGIVAPLVDLLPPGAPAPGQSVTIARPVKQPRRDGYDPFAASSAPRNPQLRSVERIFEKPRLRVGQFTVGSLPPLVWFDTELGRYLLSTRVAGDGQHWLTYAPADNNRLAQQLFAQVEAYSANA